MDEEQDDLVADRPPTADLMLRDATPLRSVAPQHEGFFFAMDTFREYQYLNELWDSGRSPWKVWG